MPPISMLEIAELFVGVADPISSNRKVRTCITSVQNIRWPEKEAEPRLDIMMKVEASGGIRQISAFAKKSTIKVQSLALNRSVLQYIPSLTHLQECFVRNWRFVTMSLQDVDDPSRSLESSYEWI